MPAHDLYALLGIPPDADLGTIKRAYRDLVFAAHPDTGQPPDPARFNDVLHAYQVLSDDDRRRSYDQAIRKAAGASRLARRPIIRETVDVPEGFASAAPSIGEFLDHVAQNFFGFHQKSHGPSRTLAVEIILNHDEARFGCRIPFELPHFRTCPRCDGVGDLGWSICQLCHGWGGVEAKAAFALDIPPIAQSEASYRIGLDNFGIENLTLDVTVRVA